jgi:hypothetical protein
LPGQKPLMVISPIFGAADQVTSESVTVQGAIIIRPPRKRSPKDSPQVSDLHMACALNLQPQTLETLQGPKHFTRRRCRWNPATPR